MKRILLIILSICNIIQSGNCQEKENAGIRILFQGMVMDANTLAPLPNSQIMINRAFSSVSGKEGAFAFYVNWNDTVIFKSLGYKPTILHVSDTLTEREFITGIFMNKDTVSIGEVIIVPRFTNLKSEILNASNKTSATFDNARYNVAVSACQGRNSQSTLGDPADNYAFLIQKQKVNAYERGGIPSDRIIGLNPLLLVPAAYFIIHGIPEKPEPLKPELISREVEQIHKKYLEVLKKRE
jgi:hypothetical protein